MGYTTAVIEFFLLRHGQSEANAGISDFLDSPLTLLGREQARLTGEFLRGEELTRAYVSPLRRTLETAQPICVASGLQAEVNAEVCEFFSAAHPGYYTFPGLTTAQIHEEFPRTFFGETFPCGEAWWPQELEDDAKIYARCLRVRDTLLKLYARTHADTAERIVIVSHAETVGRLTEAFLRVPPVPHDPPWSDNCGITRLRAFDESVVPAEIVTQNDTSHLGELAAYATR